MKKWGHNKWSNGKKSESKINHDELIKRGDGKMRKFNKFEELANDEKIKRNLHL